MRGNKRRHLDTLEKVEQDGHKDDSTTHTKKTRKEACSTTAE
jgi:hypothetical protein